jgi:hypothetical protein
LLRSEKKNIYGGINGGKNVSPGDEKTKEDTKKDNIYDQQLAKMMQSSDYWLFQIQSNVLM